MLLKVLYPSSPFSLEIQRQSLEAESSAMCAEDSNIVELQPMSAAQSQNTMDELPDQSIDIRVVVQSHRRYLCHLVRISRDSSSMTLQKLIETEVLDTKKHRWARAMSVPGRAVTMQVITVRVATILPVNRSSLSPRIFTDFKRTGRSRAASIPSRCLCASLRG